MMTPAQSRVYDYIRDYRAQHGYPPTVRGITLALGYAGPSTVQRHINILRDRGYLEGRERTLRPTRSGR